MGNSRTMELDSLDATLALGQRIGQRCEAGDVIALEGELGSGKTQLVRGIAMGLGIDAHHVASPTFIVVREYDGGRLPLVHVDTYRLTDLAGIDLDSLADGAVLAVEWAGRLDLSAFPNRLHLTLTHSGQTSRTCCITAHGSWGRRAEEVYREGR